MINPGSRNGGGILSGLSLAPFRGIVAWTSDGKLRFQAGMVFAASQLKALPLEARRARAASFISVQLGGPVGLRLNTASATRSRV